MRKASLQQQTIALIEQLSAEKLKMVVDYLNYLQKKETREATHELASHPEIAKSLEPKPIAKNPIAQSIIEAIEKSYDVTMEDAEALLQVIKENQMPMRFNSPFGANEQENQ